MHESDGSQATPVDPLAKVVRAAGRRTAPPREHYDQVFEATHEAWRRKVGRRRRRRWLAAAASVAILLASGAVFQMLSTSDTVEAARLALVQGTIEILLDDADSWQAVTGELSIAPGAHVRTGNDDRAALALYRGGSLRLDVETEIVVGLNRYELVTGTLYFDSDGRLPGDPLEVSTSLGLVRDIGTQFEVRAVNDVLRVRVRSGEVLITDSPANVELQGDAGSELQVTRSGSSVTRAFRPDDAAWVWVESLAIAPGSQSIRSYLTWIARETGKRLEFDSRYVERRAKAEILVGDPQDHTPMQLLGLITSTSDFRYRLTDDGAILIQRADDQ